MTAVHSYTQCRRMTWCNRPYYHSWLQAKWSQAPGEFWRRVDPKELTVCSTFVCETWLLSRTFFFFVFFFSCQCDDGGLEGCFCCFMCRAGIIILFFIINSYANYFNRQDCACWGINKCSSGLCHCNCLKKNKTKKQKERDIYLKVICIFFLVSLYIFICRFQNLLCAVSCRDVEYSVSEIPHGETSIFDILQRCGLLPGS